MDPKWVLTGEQKKVRFRNLLNKRHQIEQIEQLHQNVSDQKEGGMGENREEATPSPDPMGGPPETPPPPKGNIHPPDYHRLPTTHSVQQNYSPSHPVNSFQSVSQMMVELLGFCIMYVLHVHDDCFL